MEGSKESAGEGGCIIGKDYPKPIVDHDVVRKVNIDKMAKAYQQSKQQMLNLQVRNFRAHLKRLSVIYFLESSVWL